MHRRLISAICVISLFGFVQALGQSSRDKSKSSTILLGSAELTTGMSRAAVIARLGESYELKRAGNSDGWLVVPKQNGGKPEDLSSAIGSVVFKNDKLDSISKDWSPQDQVQGADFGRTIYGALASLENQGKTRCHIHVEENHQPTVDARAAFIICGDEYIKVDIIRTSEGEYSLVSEVIDTVERK